MLEYQIRDMHRLSSNLGIIYEGNIACQLVLNDVAKLITVAPHTTFIILLLCVVTWGGVSCLLKIKLLGEI